MGHLDEAPSEGTLPRDAPPPSVDTDVAGADSARASVLVAACTALSRLTGVVRVLTVGAVLGPTQLGNAYQVTNSLPNLVWFGFLAGSLVPSVLVPVLVRHLDSCRKDRVADVSRGFLGVIAACSLVLVPLAVAGLPLLMMVATIGVPAATSQDQLEMARFLVVLTVPQVLLYGLVGTSAAVLYSHGRFALASVGPALENVGVITVLVMAGVLFEHPAGGDARAATAQLVLLGAGSTAAVGLNAALQWWGARRCGVTLYPTGGWRDDDVALILRRAGRSVLTAGLLAFQMLLVVLLASRVTGGVVALQIALNFYAVAVALIATPIGLVVLPELSRLSANGNRAVYESTFVRSLTSALFLAVPATVGYLLLADAMADTVAAGRMEGAGEAMIAGALAALAVGLVGQTVTFTTTQAAYAVGDTRTPLRCMGVQAVTCGILCGVAVVGWDGPALVSMIALAYAGASLVGGGVLLVRVAGRWSGLATQLSGSLLRIGTGSVVMVVPVAAAARATQAVVPGRVGSALALLVACVAGLVTFVVVERVLRAPELKWWSSGFRRRTAAAEPLTEGA
jgi:putative peptidoglycan lipid II flippase